MGYLTNSGSGFLSNAVTTVSNVKSYLINKTGYLVDAIRVGIGDFGQRVLDDGGTIEASAEAATSYREITKDIYDQASLVLFPSGYKDNLLYSHKPTNGSGDFTYSRGTDTATRVGADGYIKKERVNLLLQSNQFDTTWVINTSVSEGEEGYDGTTDAWSLTRASGGSLMGRQTISLSGVSTYSIYAKINTNNGIGLALGGLSTSALFDLRDATKTQAVDEAGIISSSQKYVGNGFYRLSITANVSGSTEARIYLATADATLTDGNGGTHIIQDAQLEEGLVATPYIETTTAPVYEGLTDNLPRIDYTGGTPSILLEPSRQNRLPNSEYFGDWTNTSASFVYNVSNSPQGVKNAIRIIPNSSDFEIKAPVNTAVVSTESTFSVFLKYETGGFEYAVLGSGAPIQRYVFNIAEGTKVGSIGSTSIPDEKASIESYGNGWYRCVVTTNNTGGNKHSIYLSDDGTDIAATGADGTKGMLAWGAQAERENSYATSYIPTYGSSATRNADRMFSGDIQASNIITSTSGTLFFELDNYDTNAVQIDVERNDLAYGIRPLFRESSVLIYQRVNNVQTDVRLITNLATGRRKCAISWNGTSLITSVNGTSYTDTIDGSIAAELNEIESANWNVTDLELNQMLVFPTQLTEAELNALTAL